MNCEQDDPVLFLVMEMNTCNRWIWKRLIISNCVARSLPKLASEQSEVSSSGSSLKPAAANDMSYIELELLFEGFDVHCCDVGGECLYL
jgi:hypothetical protein